MALAVLSSEEVIRDEASVFPSGAFRFKGNVFWPFTNFARIVLTLLRGTALFLFCSINLGMLFFFLQQIYMLRSLSAYCHEWTQQKDTGESAHYRQEWRRKNHDSLLFAFWIETGFFFRKVSFILSLHKTQLCSENNSTFGRRNCQTNFCFSRLGFSTFTFCNRRKIDLVLHKNILRKTIVGLATKCFHAENN